MERQPVISQFTISDFRPSLQVDPKRVLYLDECHVELLARFLAGEHDRHLSDSLWDVSNGSDEKDFRGDDEGPFTRRLNYLNQSLGVLRGHWGTGWHFATHPEIYYLVLNKDLKTAVIFFREGWGGGLALMQRDS